MASMPDCDDKRLVPDARMTCQRSHAMIEDLERRGLLRPGSRLVESSSGNMGLALSIVCGAKGY